MAEKETATDVSTAPAATETGAQVPATPEKHPAHAILDQMTDRVNALGSYAVSELQPMIDAVRNTL